jgi:enamine deaminase RidA (YjgF/YER057c/UK114 family)
VSGAASISPDGQSAHLGDVDKQIALTMKVIGALLESRGMNWSDVTRVVAYFKSMEDAPRLSAYCRERRFPPLPVAPAHAAVCRHDLLFEAEVDALKIG